MRTEKRADLFAAFVLVSLVACAHAPGIVTAHFGQPLLTPHHDNLDGAAPLRAEAARQWKNGHVPLWNPWKRAGMPLLADTTAGALYPGNAPFLFADTDTPSSIGASTIYAALEQVAGVNAVLGALFLFVFLRVLGLGAAAAAFGGLVFACSGTMEWFAAWYIQIQSSAVWLPLVLAAVHSARAPAMAKWCAIGAAAVALQFFAGFPETSFYTGVIAIAYAGTLAFARRSAQPVAGVVAIYTAGICLAAIQLIPSLELQWLSRRPGELSLDVFQSLPASVAMLRGWIVPSWTPGLEFPPLGAYHFGPIAVLAAVVGVAAWPRRTAFFAVLLAVGFLLSLGSATPASELLHRLPGFNAFRHPFKHLFEVSFAMSVLAAFGLQRMLQTKDGAARPERTSHIIASACLLGTGWLLARNAFAIGEANPANVSLSGVRPLLAEGMEPGWRVLAARQVFQSRDPELLIGDYPSWLRVPAVHGAGPYLWTPLAEASGMIEEETTFRRGLFDGRDRTLALLSARYLVQARHDERFLPPVPSGAWKPVRELEDMRLLERDDALARVRFVDAVRCAGKEEIGASLEGSADDPADVALVDCSAGPAPAAAVHPSSSLSAKVVVDDPGALVVDTDVPGGASAFLVVSQSDFPGWHAGVDGKRALVRRVHGLVQGIELPPGTKRVELRYMPLSFLVGVALSAATLIVMLLWNVVERMPVRPGNDA